MLFTLTLKNRITYFIKPLYYFKKANLKNAFNSLGALLIVNLYFYKLKKENEAGKAVDWRDITSELNSRDSFMKLRDEYYHVNFVFN